MKKGNRIRSILVPGLLFVGLLYMLINLYKNNSSVYHSGNPIFDAWYADPEIVIFDSTYWIFPTFSTSFNEQVFLDAFSSADLVNWQKHTGVIDTSIIAWADSALWAPSAIKKDGKYYLFFSANDLQTQESQWFDPEIHPNDMIGGIGIGIADDPGGPYEDYLGKPLIGEVINGAQPIDQFVFEDEGIYYIVYGGWGRCNIGMLNNSLSGLMPFPEGDTLREITPEGYVEGPVIFKRRNTWYMMWSEGSWTNESYQVSFGTSDRPTGPYTKHAEILQKDSNIATGAGHNSVLNIPGTDEWYIIYHRRPIPNDGRDHRVTCIDKLYFDDHGNILPVKMTIGGVEPRIIE